MGVSNYDVRFRDAELARIHNSDYWVRCHRSRGDSGQGEAENAWYVSEQIAERIDDAPVLKEYIHCLLSETSEELFFVNKPYIDSYRDASEKTKDKVPGLSYIRKFESFDEKHYVRGELLMGFNRGSCKVSDPYNELCEWCSVNR